MTTKAIAPYGAWPSNISAAHLTQGAKGFGHLGLRNGELYWLEGRPDEAGRLTLVTRDPNGGEVTLLPPPWNVRSRVHEYGGTPVIAVGDDFYFVEMRDQHLYRLAPGGTPELVAAVQGRRLADFVHDAPRNRLIAVAEQHSPDGPPENFIVGIPLDGGPAQRLLTGHDFYAAPRLSPDGNTLAWLAWDHPNMPWDAAALYIAPVDAAGVPGTPLHIAGDERASVLQPEWTRAGDLLFIYEPDGWWNPWQWRNGVARPICTESAEYGVPMWGLGVRAYTQVDDDTLVCQRISAGAAELVQVRISDGRRTVLRSGWHHFGQLCNDGQRLWFIGDRPDRPTALIERRLDSGVETVVATGERSDGDTEYSAPQRIAFATAGGATAHAYFYPPLHRDYTGAPNTRPPLLVTTHGGPSGAASAALSLRVQYFTSRGWAVADIDYRGSTGYGRAYRDSLKGQWGIADVEDAVAAVDHLAAHGLVDPERVAIRGGSAGGYTTLAALAFTNRFRAGVSYYGIGDVGALARDTHKFEAHYTDQLIAPWPAAKAVYDERSPINFLDRFVCPAIFLQGALDKIVPPNQAEAMVEALRAKGVPVAYVLFPDEGHGFRNGANIRRAMESEYYFLSRVFGFVPADPLPHLPIANLLET